MTIRLKCVNKISVTFSFKIMRSNPIKFIMNVLLWTNKKKRLLRDKKNKKTRKRKLLTLLQSKIRKANKKKNR